MTFTTGEICYAVFYEIVFEFLETITKLSFNMQKWSFGTLKDTTDRHDILCFLVGLILQMTPNYGDDGEHFMLKIWLFLHRNNTQYPCDPWFHFLPLLAHLCDGNARSLDNFERLVFAVWVQGAAICSVNLLSGIWNWFFINFEVAEIIWAHPFPYWCLSI